MKYQVILMKKNDGTHRRCFNKNDDTFEKAWIEYHLKNAQLQKTYKKCNLTRNKQRLYKVCENI